METLATIVDMDDLLERCMGRVEFAERVLNIYHDRCDEDLVRLEMAVEKGDLTEVSLVAHRFKGASASASACSLRDAAAAVEEAARDDDLERARVRIGELKEEWSRFLAALAEQSTPFPPEV